MQSLGKRWGFTLGRSPAQDTTFTHTQGQISASKQANVHVCELWEGTGQPEGNPRRHGENMQTPHRGTPVPTSAAPCFCRTCCILMLRIPENI